MTAPVVLAVVGLKREARLISAASVKTVIGGGDAAALAHRLEAARRDTAVAGVISVGLCGALDAALAVGDWVVAEGVGTDGGARYPVDARWRDALVERSPAPVRSDLLAGSDVMVTTVAAKASLRAATGAVAVDMESHVAARFAAAHALPFAALRIVSDRSDRDLPPAVLAGMKPDGGMNLPGVLWALARDPRQLPALIRTGREAEIAFSRLLGGHDLLGRPGIGCPYLGELPLDMA